MKNIKLIQKVESELEGRLSQSTVSTYMYSIKRFLNRYPRPKKVTLSMVESYFLVLKLNGKSVSYRNTLLASIKALYDVLIELNEIKEHPCSNFTIDENKPSGKDFGMLLTLEELELLLNVKEERYKYQSNKNKAIIGLLIYQGLTSQELVNLRLQDVDLDSGVVHIVGGGKNRDRTIELKPSQIGTLIKYIDTDRKQLLKSSTKNLFVTMRGVPMSVDGLHGFIEKLNGAISKKVSPMIIRNSVISYWLNVRKFPLEDVQIMAGHRYPSSTEMYIHPDIVEQREALNKIHSEIFG